MCKFYGHNHIRMRNIFLQAQLLNEKVPESGIMLFIRRRIHLLEHLLWIELTVVIIDASLCSNLNVFLLGSGRIWDKFFWRLSHITQAPPQWSSSHRKHTHRAFPHNGVAELSRNKRRHTASANCGNPNTTSTWKWSVFIRNVPSFLLPPDRDTSCPRLWDPTPSHSSTTWTWWGNVG